MTEETHQLDYLTNPSVYIQSPILIATNDRDTGRPYSVAKEVEVRIQMRRDSTYDVEETGLVRYRCIELDCFVDPVSGGDFETAGFYLFRKI